MAAKDVQRFPEQRKRRRAWDLPHLVKYILLLLLLLLLLAEFAGGEFTKLSRFTWLILVLKLILIFLLIWLIRLQKALVCKLTGPTGCTDEEVDATAGRLFVRVFGTAAGPAFGSYTVEIRKIGFPTPIPDVVTYPGGGASGAAPVIAGELAQITTTSLIDDAYEITLNVFPPSAGAPKSCSITFNLLKILVYMSRVGKIPAISQVPIPNNPNPFDPAAELYKGPDLVSVGGNLSIEGAAYIYECEDRKIKDYEIRYAPVTVPGGEPPQPATDAAIPATWPVANRIVLLEYPTPGHYQPWTRVGPAPRDLINSFTSVTIDAVTFFKLQASRWSSGAAGSGRLSLILTAQDTTPGPHRYHDIQHIWLDNKSIFALITGIEGVAPCADVKLKDFLGSTINILGLAWDPLIDDAFPDTAPNDNFDKYRLTLVKQGVGSRLITDPNSRVIVPFRKTGPPPTPAEQGTLATFDIVAALDGGLATSDPAVNLPRGESCAYYFVLGVWDKTRLNDDTDTHHATHIWPICIVNNIPPGAPPGGPA